MIAVIGRTYRLLGAILKRYYGADTDEVVAKLISGVTGTTSVPISCRSTRPRPIPGRAR